MLLFKMDAIETQENQKSSDETCSNCGCALSAEWPDLAQLKEPYYHCYFPKTEDWVKAARSDCSLCRMVLAILQDAREKQCITELKSPFCRIELRQRDGRFLMVLNDTDSQWLGQDYVVVYQAGEQVLLPVWSVALLPVSNSDSSSRRIPGTRPKA